MKQVLFSALVMMACIDCQAQVTKLPNPDMGRTTVSVMEMFRNRHSTREYSQKDINLQDLGDLLWAAQGVNRDNGNLTAPTAMNKQEIVLYVFTDKDVCRYDPKSHSLTKVADGDHRDIVADRQDFAKAAPVSLVIVADGDKFGSTGEHSDIMMSVDAGIVCQNINLFCSAVGLKTVPRASMNQKAIAQLLKLGENQRAIMNNPIGW